MLRVLPIVVVVLVGAGSAADPATVTLVQTTKHALDPDATVLAIETSTSPTEDVATSLARAQHADAIVIVDQQDDRVHLRVRTQAGDWSERDLAFRPDDSREERGKTMGLLAATMIPGESPPTPPPPVIPPPPPPPAVHRFAIEIDPSLAVGLSAPSWSLGPSVLASLHIGSYFWAHLRAVGRFGPYERANASSIWFLAGPSLGIRVPYKSVFFGARAEIDLAIIALTRDGATLSRATGCATVVAEGGIQAGHWIVRVGLGPETSFEDTRILVGNSTVGSLPTSRFVFEGGVGYAF